MRYPQRALRANSAGGTVARDDTDGTPHPPMSEAAREAKKTGAPTPEDTATVTVTDDPN